MGDFMDWVKKYSVDGNKVLYDGKVIHEFDGIERVIYSKWGIHMVIIENGKKRWATFKEGGELSKIVGNYEDIGNVEEVDKGLLYEVIENGSSSGLRYLLSPDGSEHYLPMEAVKHRHIIEESELENLRRRLYS